MHTRLKGRFVKAMENTPIYVDVRQRLLKHVRALRSDGAYLPSERELAAELEISRDTLRRAMKQLIAEGYIVNCPRRGNYLPSVMPPLRIGITFGNGSTPMHTSHTAILSGEIQELARQCCRVEFLDLKRNPSATLKHFALDGLLWNDPTPARFGFIRGLQEENRLPVSCQSIIMTMEQASNFELIHFDIPVHHNFVTLDYRQVGQMRAEYFLRRGVRRPAYVGDTAQSLTYRAFLESYVKFGISLPETLHISRIEDIPEHLSRLLEEGLIDGVVSNGDNVRIENVMRIMDRRKNLPENFTLLLDAVDNLPEILARYPEVAVSAINYLPYQEIGRIAVKNLLRTIKTGKNTNVQMMHTKLEEFSPESRGRI